MNEQEKKLKELQEWLISSSKKRGRKDWTPEKEEKFQEVSKMYDKLGIGSINDANKRDDKLSQGFRKLGDIFVAGGPGGYMSGNFPSGISEGEVDVPDFSLPENMLEGIKNVGKTVVKYSKPIANAAVDGLLGVGEGAGTIMGYETARRRNNFDPNQRLPPEVQEQWKDRGDRWLRFQDLERRDDGLIYGEDEHIGQLGAEAFLEVVGLIGGPGAVKKGTTMTGDALRKFHTGEIKEAGKFKDEYVKLNSKNSSKSSITADTAYDAVKAADSKSSKIKSFTNAPAFKNIQSKLGVEQSKALASKITEALKNVSTEGIKNAGINAANKVKDTASIIGPRIGHVADEELAKAQGLLSGAANKFAAKGSQVADELAETTKDRLLNAAGTTAKVAAANAVYKPATKVASIAAEYATANTILQRVLSEHGSKNLTEEDKKQLGYWYASQYVITHSIKGVFDRRTKIEKLKKSSVFLRNLFAAEGVTLTAFFALMDPKDQDEILNVVKLWASGVLDYAYEKGALSKKDHEAGNYFLNAPLEDEEEPVQKNSGGLLYPRTPMRPKNAPMVGLLGR